MGSTIIKTKTPVITFLAGKKAIHTAFQNIWYVVRIRSRKL